MLAIDNKEPEELPDCREGDLIVCPTCGKTHPIEYAKLVKSYPPMRVDAKLTNVSAGKFGFFQCGGESYLVAIDGKLLSGLTKAEA